MSKKRVVHMGKQGKKEAALARFRKELGEDVACFVLITCTNPASDGKMEVELDYEGDQTLAAFLIDNAAQVFEEKSPSREIQ